MKRWLEIGEIIEKDDVYFNHRILKNNKVSKQKIGLKCNKNDSIILREIRKVKEAEWDNFS